MNGLKKFFARVKAVLGFGLGFIAEHSYIAVTVTENLKKIAEGQLDNKIAALFPGTWAPELVAHLELIAPKVALQVAKYHELIHRDWQGMTNQQIQEAIVKELQGLNKVKRGKFLADLAGLLNFKLAAGTKKQREAWEEAQVTYHRDFKNQ
jgi:hypothetical protein